MSHEHDLISQIHNLISQFSNNPEFDIDKITERYANEESAARRIDLDELIKHPNEFFKFIEGLQALIEKRESLCDKVYHVLYSSFKLMNQINGQLIIEYENDQFNFTKFIELDYKRRIILQENIKTYNEIVKTALNKYKESITKND